MFTQLENDHFEAHFTGVLWSKKQCDCGHIKAEKSAPPPKKKSRKKIEEGDLLSNLNSFRQLVAENGWCSQKKITHLRANRSFEISYWKIKRSRRLWKESILMENVMQEKSWKSTNFITSDKWIVVQWTDIVVQWAAIPPKNKNDSKYFRYKTR